MKLYTINPLYTSIFSVFIFAALTSSFSMLFDNGKTYINTKYEIVYGGDKTLNVDGMVFKNLKSYRELTDDEQLKLQEIKKNRDIASEKMWKERDDARILREKEQEQRDKENERREMERVQREKENEQREIEQRMREAQWEKEQEQRDKENERREKERVQREKENEQREIEQRMREAEKDKEWERREKWNNDNVEWTDMNEIVIRNNVTPKVQIVKRTQPNMKRKGHNMKRKEFNGKPAEPISQKQRRLNSIQNTPRSRGASRIMLTQ